MKILTKAIEKVLRENSKNPNKEGQKPVLKLFNPMGAATWLRSGLRIERDLHFRATKTLDEYAKDAREHELNPYSISFE